ncbi:DUF1858 domain-containing protein [Williamwhitmania taraxaci]|uniref:Hybrid cluster protein-associated redox disulfide domain-containing protein n=1 Tax=Williamwhitmania taraxaci TaxID=1640674 RepID=A0A1G6HPN7_9BACT|nr:DUF1858 domain-containing protein [Williamwhitmania taraxaci]SDB96202.1 hypothetical protein SAMN05216323_101253 [Williamwhitmania taraxaci]
MKITKATTVEDVITNVPLSVKYLCDKGIRCIKCGEPIWGTIEDLAKEKGLTSSEIDALVVDLQNLPTRN